MANFTSSIPDDVLLYIFDHSTPYSNDIWSISKVCQRWRSTALSCTGLWKYLYYNGRGSNSTPKLDIARMIAQLKRSGSSTSLHISLTLHSDIARSSHLVSEMRREQAVCKLLLGNAPRFRVVKLRGWLQSHSDFPSTAPHFCNLRDLTLTRSNALQTTDGVIFARTSLLNLNALVLIYSTLETPWTGPNVVPFWPLDRETSSQAVLDVLSNTPTLTHLEVVFNVRSYGPDSHGSHLSAKNLNQLRSVVFSIMARPKLPPHGPPLYLLNHIQAPQLHSFTLRYMYEQDLQNVRRFLQIASSSLLVLSLENLRLPNIATLLPILQIVPGLRTFEASGLSGLCISSLLEAMTVTPERSTLLPRLERLNLEGAKVAVMELKAVVQSRVPADEAAKAETSCYSGIKNIHFIHAQGTDELGNHIAEQSEQYYQQCVEDAQQWGLKLQRMKPSFNFEFLFDV